MRRWWILVGFVTLALGSLPAATPVYAEGGPVDPSLLAGLSMRSIGPAGMSGRVTAIEAEVGDADRIFVGTASGGVWRSVNGGQSFEPIFDRMPVHSIGAVALDPSNPAIVWVGTGEGNPRNSVSLGNGIYKSLDGGETWTPMGLKESERIHRIVVHPRRSEVVYVCAPGRAWGEGGERGVWKTEDGGKSWRPVLEVDGSTGCGDLVMDPQNPDKLFAGMWQFRRQPWFFTSGGPGSGLYVTHDGGESWRRLTPAEGLPEGELGRIGLAIAPSDSRVVYALVEAEKNALLRSTDSGRTFTTMNDAPQLAPRPFYFCDLQVDPKWPDRIYLLDYELRVSDDGGVTVSVLPGGGEDDLHVDHHALWINPRDPEYLLNGNDGGVAISRDRGHTFRVVNNLPLGQMYHVAVDDEVPYNVYGGLQDNGSWRGASAVFDEGGIRNHHWQPVGDGDGFDVRPDPDDSRRGYAMWQGGQLTRWDLDAGTWRPIVPPPPADGTPLRFNWDAALALDPFDPAAVYYGSQFLHRSRDRGDSWEIVSPDLTSNDPERQRQAESGGLTSDVTQAENFTTLVAVAPSPLARGQIWTGSDDGRLHLTRDGGATWSRLDSRLPVGVPEGAWIPHIEASSHDAATAFVVLDDHRRSNFKPYVARTDDHGTTWKLLPLDGVRGYALVLIQDPVRAELLYLGTEFGLWISLDGGASWFPFRHGLPTASVMDLVVHPRDHDLVVGTHGRSIFILDDIRPLRELSAEVLIEPLHLFPPPPAQQYWPRPGRGDYGYGVDTYRGENRPYGALITFSANLPDLPHPDPELRRESVPGTHREVLPKAEIVVLDAKGQPLRSLHQPIFRGINRVVWNLQREPFEQPPWQKPVWINLEDGIEVPPGDYEVEIRFREHRVRAPFQVLADPASDNTPEDWQARWNTLLRIGVLNDAIAEAAHRVRRTYRDLEVVGDKLQEAARDAGETNEARLEELDLVARVRRLAEELRQLENRLWLADDRRGIPAETDAFTVMWYAFYYNAFSWDPPTPSALAHVDRAERVAREVLGDIGTFFKTQISPYREAIRAEGVELLPDQ